MPSPRLTPATLEDYDALYQMAQLYQYDFAEFIPGELDQNGEYPYLDVQRYLTGLQHAAYLGRVDGYLRGFALVDHQRQQGDGPGRYLAEFFVLRPYRRQGIGRALARQLFDTYRGVWEIAEVEPNTPAQAFWRRVIGEYTNGRYREFRSVDEEGINCIWQVFDSSQW